MLKTGKVSFKNVVKHKAGTIATKMGADTVILSVDKGKYYNLGETGGEIWSLLENEVTVDKIVENLIHVFDIDQSLCREQVITFLESLYKEGLIEIK